MFLLGQCVGSHLYITLYLLMFIQDIWKFGIPMHHSSLMFLLIPRGWGLSLGHLFYCWPDLANSFRSPMSLVNVIELKQPLVLYPLTSYPLIHTMNFPFPLSLLGKESSSTQLLKTQTVQFSGKTYCAHSISDCSVNTLWSWVSQFSFLGFSHCYLWVGLMRPSDFEGPKGQEPSLILPFNFPTQSNLLPS